MHVRMYIHNFTIIAIAEPLLNDILDKGHNAYIYKLSINDKFRDPYMTMPIQFTLLLFYISGLYVKNKITIFVVLQWK